MAGTVSPAAAARPGFLVTYKGSEIGVLARIVDDDHGGDRILHIRGGISGALEYLVPARAVVAVDQAARRAEVDPRATFVSRSVGCDGHVVVTASAAGDDPGLGDTPLGACVGLVVYTPRCRIGTVVSVIEASDGSPAVLVVRTSRLPRRRYSQVPVSRIVSLHERRGRIAVR